MQRSLSIAPKTLHKIRIYIAVFLLLLAIVLYLFLHDIDSLYIFSSFRMSRFYAFIKSCRIDVSSLQAWQARFIYCYLIDALWFSSLLLLLSYFWTGYSILKYIIFFCFALFTEILQLFVKKLGTFDIYDVFLYTIITGVFLCVEVVFNYKLRNR